MLDLTDVQLLVSVARTGTISAGAEECGLSLAAASARLSGVERRHGIQLFRRHRRGVTATPAGEDLLADASRLLEHAIRFEDRLAARSRGLRDELVLATTTSAADALPEFLAAALTSAPTLRIELVEMTGTSALEALREGRVHLAVVAVLTADVPGCQVMPLWDDPLVVIGARRPGRPPVMTLAEVTEEPMVGLTPTMALQRLVDGEAARAGLHPVYRVRLPTLAAVCSVASTGAGPAIVPRAVARRHHVPDRAQVPLAEAWGSTERRAVLAAVDFGRLPEAAARFVDLVREHRDELGTL